MGSGGGWLVAAPCLLPAYPIGSAPCYSDSAVGMYACGSRHGRPGHQVNAPSLRQWKLTLLHAYVRPCTVFPHRMRKKRTGRHGHGIFELFGEDPLQGGRAP
eukprot:358368-Chlamydomonas_euryale.AAC.5